jgi:putative oxidoreductase
MLRDITLLGSRVVVGGYMAGHGAQKLFGVLGGHGLEATGKGFASMGLEPGREMAALAGATELGSGLLTAFGLGGPIGPVAMGSVMAVAAGTAHRGKGPFSMTGGPELPLIYMAAATTIAVDGPGRLSLDWLLRTRVPRSLVVLTVLGSAVGAKALISKSISTSIAKQQQDLPAPGEDAGSAAETREPISLRRAAADATVEDAADASRDEPAVRK